MYGFKEWLKDIVRDVIVLTKATGLRLEYNYFGENGVCAYSPKGRAPNSPSPKPIINDGSAFGRLPDVLAEIIYLDQSVTYFSPLEIVAAYRCPKVVENTMGGTNDVVLRFSDQWAEATRQYAAGLFAKVSWLRFAAHLFNPLYVNYHPDQVKHAMLAGVVWSKLLGVSAVEGQRRWSGALYDTGIRRGAHRSEFWTKDITYHELGALGPPLSI